MVQLEEEVSVGSCMSRSTIKYYCLKKIIQENIRMSLEFFVLYKISSEL